MLNFAQPYPSQRSPVCAENVVATSQPLAAQAGLNAMRRGGNAVDAALAAAITLTVVEPNNNGVGSDAFAILWTGDELVGLNASGRSPEGWSPQRFRGAKEMPSHGWDSVTVPGAVSAWVALSERYGALAFDELFEDAVRYAREGFQVGPISARYWQNAVQQFADYEGFQRHFAPAPDQGARFVREDLAATLEEIATTHGESFYRGRLAAAIADTARAQGGVMTQADLESHQADWVQPIEQAYRHVALHEIPPNGQGLAAQIALGILQHLPATELDSADALHLEIEAMKIAIRASFDHFADPAAMRLAPEALLGAGSLEAAAASIGAQAADLPPKALPIGQDTVYLTTADAEGRMVSFIQSNFAGFGSGVVIPDTGIAMQNRGSGFTLDPAHPNCVGPRKRPFHTIIPGFVTEAGAPKLAFGVMGGHMQHQGHVQMVRRIFDHHQNPQAASDAPRWHVYPDFSVGLEPGIAPEIHEALQARGHRVREERRPWIFGGAQLIYRSADGYIAGSDHRKEGGAVGF